MTFQLDAAVQQPIDAIVDTWVSFISAGLFFGTATRQSLTSETIAEAGIGNETRALEFFEILSHSVVDRPGAAGVADNAASY